MAGGVLRVERSDGVLTLWLDRPEKRNALDATLVAALYEALGEAAVDPEARVVVLRGAGPAFCAGADLTAMERIAEDADPVSNLQDAEELGALLVRMRRHPRPILAAVHGHALAGGAGLALAARTASLQLAAR